MDQTSRSRDIAEPESAITAADDLGNLYRFAAIDTNRVPGQGVSTVILSIEGTLDPEAKVLFVDTVTGSELVGPFEYELTWD